MGWTFYNSNGQRLSTSTTLIDNLDIDGATDIGAAIVDADLFIIDDGAGGTNRKTAASRIKTYVGAAPAQANQTAIEAETNQDTYIPPDLMKHHPGVAKAHGHHAGSGSLASNSYNLDSTAKDSTGVYTWTFTTDFSAATYAVAGTDTSTVCAVHSDGSGKATGEWVERCYDSNTNETFADGGYDAAFYGDQ